MTEVNGWSRLSMAARRVNNFESEHSLSLSLPLSHSHRVRQRHRDTQREIAFFEVAAAAAAAVIHSPVAAASVSRLSLANVITRSAPFSLSRTHGSLIQTLNCCVLQQIPYIYRPYYGSPRERSATAYSAKRATTDRRGAK